MSDRPSFAAEALVAYAGAISPLYTEARELFAAELGAQARLNGLQVERADRLSNKGLLRDCVQYLPHAMPSKGSGCKFSARTPFEARLIQASTYNFSPSSVGYMVGRRVVHGEDSQVDILLHTPHGAEQNPASLFMARVIKTDLEAADRACDLALDPNAIPFAEQDIDSLFDEQTGLLTIGSYTNPSMTYISGWSKKPEKSWNYNYEQTHHNPLAYVRLAKDNEVQYLGQGIPSSAMDEFNVYDHLNKLGTSFGVVNEFAEQFNQHQPE